MREPIEDITALVVAEQPDDAELLTSISMDLAGGEVEDPQEFLDWENEDHVATIKHTQALTEKAALLLEDMKPAQRKVALAALSGEKSYTAIAQRADVSIPTVMRYMKEDGPVRDFIITSMKRLEYANAAKREHRLNMAWRIALRNERAAPKVSLDALKLIATQTGEIQQAQQPNTQAPTIVLANFAPPAQQQAEDKPAIEGASYEVVTGED